MLEGIIINELRPYTCKGDKDNPTKFYIRNLDSFVRAHIEDQTSVYQVDHDAPDSEMLQLKTQLALRSLLAVKFGIGKIENLKDPKTQQPVQYEAEKVKIGEREYDVLPDAVLAILPKISELAQEVLNSNTLTEGERKN
jgi:hypothetical protein